MRDQTSNFGMVIHVSSTELFLYPSRFYYYSCTMRYLIIPFWVYWMVALLKPYYPSGMWHMNWGCPNLLNYILYWNGLILFNLHQLTALVQEVNGKEVQIQLTGFMEKNTVKFMKELWILLLSAQKNASGVPQQFLDAKEEEIRKKKVSIISWDLLYC